MSENLFHFATAVVIHQDRQRILLHKREDFRIWSLPGDGLDDGETAQAVAIREAFEETSYQIAITRFIGSYHSEQFGNLRYVFSGNVIGGHALDNGPETVAVSWFHPHELPSGMTSSTYDVIADTLANYAEPVQRVVYFPILKVLAYRTLIKLRDLRNKIDGRP